MAIVEASLRGERSQPSRSDLDTTLRKLQRGKKWSELFPGVAGLRLDTAGSGLSVSLHITKQQGEAVHLVPEGTPGATVVAVRKVNELGYCAFGLYQLAAKVGLTAPKALAVIQELGIQDSVEFFKVIKMGKTIHKRYSVRAVEKVEKELPGSTSMTSTPGKPRLATIAGWRPVQLNRL